MRFCRKFSDFAMNEDILLMHMEEQQKARDRAGNEIENPFLTPSVVEVAGDVGEGEAVGLDVNIDNDVGNGDGNAESQRGSPDSMEQAVPDLAALAAVDGASNDNEDVDWMSNLRGGKRARGEEEYTNITGV